MGNTVLHLYNSTNETHEVVVRILLTLITDHILRWLARARSHVAYPESSYSLERMRITVHAHTA